MSDLPPDVGEVILVDAQGREVGRLSREQYDLMYDEMVARMIDEGMAKIKEGLRAEAE